MKISFMAKPKNHDILMKINEGERIADLVEQLAAQHGVTAQETGLDKLAGVITQLAGDSTSCDKTERLLIALRRKNIISGEFLVKALSSHLRAQPL